MPHEMQRWLHKSFALANNYFWIPCPLCGEEFGGHEWDGRSIMVSETSGRGFCNDHPRGSHGPLRRGSL